MAYVISPSSRENGEYMDLPSEVALELVQGANSRSAAFVGRLRPAPPTTANVAAFSAVSSRKFTSNQSTRHTVGRRNVSQLKLTTRLVSNAGNR